MEAALLQFNELYAHFTHVIYVDFVLLSQGASFLSHFIS